MTPANSPATEPRRFSIRLPRPLWIGLATIVTVVVAVGLRIGVPIYRQRAAIRAIEQNWGHVVTRPRGPKWIRDRMGDERMKMFDEVVEAHIGGRRATDAIFGHIG